MLLFCYCLFIVIFIIIIIIITLFHLLIFKQDNKNPYYNNSLRGKY